MGNSIPKLLRSHSLARAGLASALVILLLGATAPPLAAQTDNFNDGNDTSWTHYSITGFYNPAFPGGYCPYGGTTYTFPNDDSGGKAYKLDAAATIYPPTGTDAFSVQNARGGSYQATPTYTTRFSLGTDLLAWSTTGRPTVGFLWYMHEIYLGSTKGYAGTWSPNAGNIYLSMIYNEGQAYYFAALNEDGDLMLKSTDRIRMEVSSHDGSTFVMTAYNQLEPNTPWCSAIGQDSSWSGVGGSSGFLIFNEDYPANYGASATFDNYVATEPAAGTMPAMVTDVYPPPAGKCTTIYATNTIMILNRDTLVTGVNSDIALCLDGVWLPQESLGIDWNIDWSGVYKPGNRTYPNTFARATVTYPITNLLAWGSNHTNIFAFKDSADTWRTNTWTWTVAYPYLFASNSLPVGSLSVRGFDARMVQSYSAGNYPTYANIGNGGLANSLAAAKAVLAYQYAVNLAATNVVQSVAWDKAVPGSYEAVTNFPGLCADNSDLNSFAVQTCAYLHLTAGLHRFYVDSDDHVGIYSGASLTDTSTALLETTGVVHRSFDFVVEADGLYPMNVIYEEGAGGVYLVLNSVNLNDDSKTLLNASGGVAAYYPLVCQSSTSVAGPYTADAAANAGNALTTTTGGCTGADQTVTGGTVTIPVPATQKFYRLDGPRATKITGIQKVDSNLVITYQVQ